MIGDLGEDIGDGISSVWIIRNGVLIVSEIFKGILVIGVVFKEVIKRPGVNGIYQKYKEIAVAGDLIIIVKSSFGRVFILESVGSNEGRNKGD